MNENEEKEADEKAKLAVKMTADIAEKTATMFEKWLSEHQDSTREEAHKKLVSSITSAIVSNTFMLFALK